MDAFGEWKCGWPSSSLLISSSDSPCRIEYPPTLWVPENGVTYATWVYSRDEAAETVSP